MKHSARKWLHIIWHLALVGLVLSFLVTDQFQKAWAVVDFRPIVLLAGMQALHLFFESLSCLWREIRGSDAPKEAVEPQERFSFTLRF